VIIVLVVILVVLAVAYPEPIPALKAKDAKQFVKQLESFELNPAQKKIYTQARERFPPE